MTAVATAELVAAAVERGSAVPSFNVIGLEHAEGIVVTDDLQAALEAESGSDLDRFFEQWIHGTGYPCFQLRLSSREAPERADRLLVTPGCYEFRVG